MIIITEKKLRAVIREEFERFMEYPQTSTEPVTTLHAATGADVIFPNYIKEAFDAGQIKSVRDIL